MMTRKILLPVAISIVWLAFIAGFIGFAQADLESYAARDDEPASAAIVRAQLSQRIRPINPNMFCYNASAPSWENPEFQNLVRQLNPGALRVSSERIAATAGPTPVFVLDMLSSSLEEQLANLRAAQAQGMPIQYVELGGEYYQTDSDAAHIFPTGEDYARAAGEWAEAIHAEFPQAHIALAGAPPAWAQAPERIQRWNKAVFPLAAHLHSAVAFHPYAETGLHQRDAFTGADVPIMLGMPFLNWRRYQGNTDAPGLAALPDGARVWMTEYNTWENPARDSLVGKTWAQGLFAATQSLIFLEDARVDLMCVQELAGDSVWAAATRPKGDSERFTLTANGLALEFLGQAMTGMTTGRQIEFARPPFAFTLRDVEYPALLGWAFWDETDRQTAVILNLSGETVNLLLDPPIHFPEQYRQRTANPTHSGYEAVEEIAGSVEEDGALALRPYSVTYLATP